MIEFTLRFIQCFANFLIIYYFLSGLFSKRISSLIADLFVIAASSAALSVVNNFKSPIINTLLAALITSLMVIVIFRGNFFRLLLAGIVSDTIAICCEFIQLFIMSFFIKDIVVSVAAVTVQNIAISFISTGMFFIIMWLSKLFLANFNIIKSHGEHLNIRLFPLPVLSILIAYFIMAVIQLVELHNSMLICSIVIVLSLLVVNIIVFASDSDSKKKYQYRAQISEMNSRQEMQKALIMQQDSHIQEMNALTHDFKHQLLTLQNLVSIQSPNGDASAYIAQAIQNLPKSSLFIGVSCSALRSILIHTSKECARLGIMFNTELRFTDFDFMTYQDICTIFSNALDNAVCACTELKNAGRNAAITLKTDRLNHMALISVVNDKINDIIEADGKICTTKEDNTHHGIGIMNIKRAAEQYGGKVEINYTQDEFSINILLMIT